MMIQGAASQGKKEVTPESSEKSTDHKEDLKKSSKSDEGSVKLGNADDEAEQQNRKHKRHRSFDSSIPSLIDTYTTPTSSAAQYKEKTTAQTEPPPETREQSTSQNALEAEKILSNLLGIQLDKWPYSESILSSTLSLKAEIERTKRESLKVQSVQLSIDLLKFAIDSGVPPHLVPYVFLSGDNPKDKSEWLKEQEEAREQGQGSNTEADNRSTQTSTSVFKVNIPQQTQFQFHHWQPGDPRSDISSTGATVASQTDAEPQHQTPTQPKTHHDEDKKRKFSDVVPSSSKHQQRVSQLQQQASSSSSRSASHRRNQSEANVSQLRSIYESQIIQQQQQQQQQQNQQKVHQQLHQQQQQPYVPPQQFQPSLRSPYYTPAEIHQSQQRPLYYQYAQNVPSPQVHYIQGPPPPVFQFPRPPPPPSMPNIPPPQMMTQIPPQSIPPLRHGPGSSITGSPDASGVRSKGKSDVSFLISTPTNPPK